MTLLRSQLVIDASQWQALLKGDELKAGGVVSCIIKSSQDDADDPAYARHAKVVVDSGLILQNYHWVDPIGDPKKELAKMLQVWGKFPSKFFWLDCEQWWTNWGTWQQAITRKIEWAAVAKFSGQQIADSYQFLLESLTAQKIPCGVYTSYGFATSWGQPMSKWLSQYPLWIAHYGRQPSVVTAMTWDELKAKWLPTYAPLLPPGADINRMVGHQFTGDACQLPGMYGDVVRMVRSAADVSVFNEAFMTSISGQLPTPQVPPVKSWYGSIDGWARTQGFVGINVPIGL